MISKIYFRIINCNHQQLGHVIGMLTGLMIAIYSLPYLSVASLPWIGTIKALPIIFIKMISLPFISGLFANIFSNLGSGLDVLTNEKTILHFVRKEISKEQNCY